MNRFIVSSLFLSLCLAGTSPVLAQQGVNAIAKARARSLANGGTAQPPPPQPGAPAPGTSTNAGGGISAEQQANIDKLASDISDIKAGVRVPLDQRQQIQTDALVLAKGAAKPSGQSMTNLVRHLSSALAGSAVTLKDPAPAQLARDINIVVNSMNLSSGQVQPIIIAARNTLLMAHVPEDDYKPVVDDLNAIVTELQKNKPKPVP